MILTCLFIFLVWFVWWRRKVNNEFWKYIMAIPGPYCYPFVGTVDMLMADNEKMFEINRTRALKFFPVFRVRSFSFAMVFLLSPEDIELVLKNVKHITKGRIYDFLQVWLGTGLLTSTDSKWQHRRKILTPAFHFSILQNFIEIFNRETDSLIEEIKSMQSQPYINIIKPITDFTLNSVGETSLGVQINKQPNIKQYKSSIYEFGEIFTYQLTRPWLRIKPLFKLSPISEKTSGVLKTLHDFSSGIIQQRKQYLETKGESYSKRKRMAMLDLLLKARFEEGVDIDDEGIREEVDTFMFEGHDTTSLAICYTLLVLANKPKVQDDILQEIYSILGEDKLPDYQDLGEMKYMERCIKEVLRIFPSVPVISRRLGENLTLNSGYVVPKGTNVTILIYDMHHSPQVWDNPEHFDPDRFLPENIANRHPFAYLPFSAGQRNCIGQRYAILEIKAALCGILRHFELKPVDKIEDIKMKADLVLRSVRDIKVQFVERNKDYILNVDRR